MKKTGNEYRYLALDSSVIIPLMELLYQSESDYSNIRYAIRTNKCIDEWGEFVKEEVKKVVERKYNMVCPDEVFDLYKLIKCGAIRPVCLKGSYEQLVEGVPFASRNWLNTVTNFIDRFCYVSKDDLDKYCVSDDKIKRRAELYCKEYSDGYSSMESVQVLANNVQSDFDKLVGCLIRKTTEDSFNDIGVRYIKPIALLKKFIEDGNKAIAKEQSEENLKKELQHCADIFFDKVIPHLASKEKKSEFLDIYHGFTHQLYMGQWVPSNDACVMAEASVKGIPLLTCNGQDFVYYAIRGGAIEADRRTCVQEINRAVDNLGDDELNPGAYDMKEIGTIFSELVNNKRYRCVSLYGFDFADLDELVGKEDIEKLDKKFDLIKSAQHVKESEHEHIKERVRVK